MPNWLSRLLVPGLLLLAAIVLDVVLFPSLDLPVAILYTPPMLAAAQWLPAGAARLFIVAILGVYLALSVVRDISPTALWPRLVALGFVGYLASLLAVRLEEAFRSRAEAEEAKARAEIAQRRAEAAKARAEAAQQHLQRFTGMVAHDLRGPLTVIMGYAQLLSRTAALTERGAAMIETIQREAHRMNRLVGDLLDAGRIGAGAFTVQRQPVDLVALARQVVETYRVEAPNHVVELHAPDALHGVWDPDRLTQVLNNLLGNAVKFSPLGGTIGVRIWRAGQQALVSVSDQGIGIRREDVPLLFEPFSRLHHEQEAKGAGLGLYISSGIVHAHGGEMWASSGGLRCGATFTFCLPLEEEGGARS